MPVLPLLRLLLRVVLGPVRVLGHGVLHLLTGSYRRLPLPAAEDAALDSPDFIHAIGGASLGPYELLRVWTRMGKPEVFKMRFLWVPLVVTTRKEDLPRVCDGGVKPWMYDKFREFFGAEAILFKNGEEAKVHRVKLNKTFTVRDFQRNQDVVARGAARLLQRCVAHANHEQGLDLAASNVLLRQYTLESIGQVGLGLDLSDPSNAKVALAVQDLLMVPLTPLAWIPLGTRFVTWYYGESLRLVKDVIERAVAGIRLRRAHADNEQDAEAGADEPRRTVVDFLLDSIPDGCRDPDTFVLDNMRTMMVGATDSSAVTLQWALLVLAKNQVYQDRVREEIRSVRGMTETTTLVDSSNSNNDDTTQSPWADFAKIQKLKLVDAVIREILRLYPVFTTATRTWSEPCPELYIDEGNRNDGIIISVPYVLLHTKYYEKPLEFLPERWLQGGDADHAAFGTFAGGHRSCIGRYFAMQTLKTALATLLEEFRVVPVNPDLPFPALLQGPGDGVAMAKGEYPLRFQSVVPALLTSS